MPSGAHGRRARQRRSAARARPGAARRNPAAPADGVPDPQAALRPLHPGDGARRLRHQPRGFRLPRPFHRRELRARAHHLLRLRRRVDSAHPRSPIHPHRNDFAAADGQRRPPGQRHHGAARPRQHPGLHRHSDVVQPAARLPADAEGGHPRHPGRLPRRGRVQEAERLLGQRRRLHDQPAQGVVGRRRPRGQRLGLRLPAAAVRPARHLPDRHGDARRRGGGLLPAGPESRGRVGPRPDAAPRHGPPEVAGGARPQPDRVGDLVEGRSGDRVRRTENRGHRDRGVLLPRGHACGEGGIVHPDAAAAAVAPQGASSRPATARANASSSTSWASGSRRGWPVRPTSATGRCWT